MTDRIEVVSAAMIRRGGDGIARLLLGQRRMGGSYPGAWCTPGGKVEASESDLDALTRELREEVGLVVDPLRDLLDAVCVYAYDMRSTTTGKPAQVRCYTFAAPEAFKAQPLDGLIGVGWFSSVELRGLQLAPADHAHRDILRDLNRSV